MKNKLIIGIFLFVIMLTGCREQNAVVMTADAEEVVTDKEDLSSAAEAIVENEEIYVYVCGHVSQPGVYQLTTESRICDALALAGGVLEDGNAEVLNQAEHMTDGQTLYVPGIGESADVEADPVQDDGMIDINKAAKEDLMALPGIGESKAVTIIQYREEHGAFKAIEELMDIPGIKEGVFNKIKDKIKIS